MNIKEYSHLTVTSAKPVRRRREARSTSTPNFVAAFLGVVCVAGVFGLLGLLYSLG
jgi:hypothetical protein